MSKFLLAALTAAAVAGAGFTASAAEPAPAAPQPAASEPYVLDDAQMDTATAGADQINIAIVIPIQIVNTWNIAYATGDGATASIQSVVNALQTTIIRQKNNVRRK